MTEQTKSNEILCACVLFVCIPEMKRLKFSDTSFWVFLDSQILAFGSVKVRVLFIHLRRCIVTRMLVHLQFDNKWLLRELKMDKTV